MKYDLHNNNAAIHYRIPLFCIVTLLFWFSMYTCVPVLTAYVEYLGASHGMAGLVVGMYGLSQMLLRIPVGIASDRFHKRRLFIIFGFIFSILAGIGILMKQEITWVLVLRCLSGAAAATWVDFTILFASYYAKEQSTKAIGTISFYNTIGQMLGILSGGYFAQAYGWESAFVLGGLVGILGLLGSLFIVEKFDASAQRITFQGVVEVASDRVLLTVSFLAILFQVLTFATVFGFTPVFAQSLGASKLDMGLLTFFSTFPTALASLIGGRHLAQRIGEKNIILLGFILNGLFTVAIPFCGTMWLLMATQALAGFGRGFASPVLMSLSIKHMESGRRATAMGFYQAIYGLGMFAGPLFIGLASDWMSLRDGFILVGLLGCVTAWLAHVMMRGKAASTMTVITTGKEAGV